MSLVLGLDISPLRLGWGLVRLEDGAPVACGCEAIDLPDHGWLEVQAIRALRILQPRTLCFRNGEIVPDDEGDIALVYVELPAFPAKSGTESAFKAGRAVQVVVQAVAERWPWAWPQDPEAAKERYLRPSEWRKLAGKSLQERGLTSLAGNASKDDVHCAAVLYLQDAGLPYRGMEQDAADALLVALAGQRRNAEVWERAQEAGVA